MKIVEWIRSKVNTEIGATRKELYSVMLAVIWICERVF